MLLERPNSMSRFIEVHVTGSDDASPARMLVNVEQLDFAEAWEGGCKLYFGHTRLNVLESYEDVDALLSSVGLPVARRFPRPSRIEYPCELFTSSDDDDGVGG